MNLSQFKKLKSPYILILIGPPLSGKSTFCDKFKSIFGDIKVISRDQIVLDTHGSDNYSDAFKNVSQSKVDRELHNQLVSANKNKINVVVDMTNLSSKRRRGTLSYFDDDYTKIAVIFPVPEWDELVNRNKKRTSEENKNIPEHVIKSMLSSYQPIRHDEGFDKIVSI